MVAQATSWEGTVVSGGRYSVKEKLGEGGMALVYRAQDERLQADVVIKVPRRGMLEEPQFAARFLREIRSLVQLSHPHIVKVLDVGEKDGMPFAVLQYLAGGTLREKLPRGREGRPTPMPLEQLRGWLPQVAAALDFIHQQRFIHRDVKPDNILFDDQGHVYISDFGIAKVMAANRAREHTVLTGTGMVLGTAHYMAPELMLGRAYDGKVDQYALAVSVFELLSGRFPFQGTTPAAIAVEQTKSAPPLLDTFVPGLPKSVTAAVQRALSRNAGDRFPSCTAFAEAVVSAKSGPAAVVQDAIKPASVRKPEIADPPKNVGTASSHPGQTANVTTCPGCNKVFRLQVQAEGKHFRCPSCQSVFQPVLRQSVDPGRSGVETARGEQAGATVSRVPARSRKYIRRIKVTAAALVTMLFLIGFGITAWFLWVNETDQNVASSSTSYSQRIVTTVSRPDRETTAKAPVHTPLLHLETLPELILKAGESKTIVVRIKRQACQGPVKVYLEGLPDQVSCSSISVGADQSTAQLKFNAEGKAPPFESDLFVNASLADLSTRNCLRLKVVPAPVVQDAPSLILDVLPTKQVTLDAGKSQTLEVKVERRGISGPVKVELNDLPKDVLGTSLLLAESEDRGAIKLKSTVNAKASQSQIRISATAGNVKTTTTLVVAIRVPTLVVRPLQTNAITPSMSFEIAEWDQHKGFVISPKMRYLALHSKGIVQLMSLSDGKTLANIKGDPPLVFSSVGYLATRQRATDECQIWSVPAGKLVARLKRAHPLTFSPDGLTLFLYNGIPSQLSLWQYGYKKAYRVILDASNATISPNGRLLAAKGRSLNCWSVLAAKQLVRQTRQLEQKGLGLLETVRRPIFRVDLNAQIVAFSPDSRLIAATKGKVVYLLSSTNGKSLAVLQGHTSDVTTLRFSPNSRLLVTLDRNYSTRVWSVPVGNVVMRLPNSGDSFAISPDSQSLAMNVKDQIQFWDLTNFAKSKVLVAPGSWAGVPLSFTPDGRQLISRSGYRIRTWPMVSSQSASGKRRIEDTLGRLWLNWPEAKPKWSVAKPALPPLAHAQVIAANSGQVYAGDLAFLDYAVENKGKGDLCQMWSHVEIESPQLTNLGMLIGHVSPNNKMRKRIGVLIPPNHELGPMKGKVVFHEGNGYAPADQDVTFNVSPLPRPDFSMSARVIEDGSGNSVGNKDGQVQAGEAADILVTVKNLTSQRLNGLFVVLKPVSPEGEVVIVNSRADLGDVADQENARARVTFRIKPQTILETVKCELRAKTPDGRVFAIKTMNIPIK